MVVEVALHEPEVAEYQKIRKYVLNRIAQSAGSAMRLDSTRALARKFGVTHPTAVKALRDLVADGYLTVKPGIGTFTNPGKVHVRPGSKLIGLLDGDGKQAFFGILHWHFGVFAETLASRSERYLMQNCLLSASPSKPQALANEIKSLGLDGLFWLDPNSKMLPAMLELKASGVAVLAISIAAKTPGISCFRYDFEGDNYAVAKLMLDEGRRRVTLLLPANNKDFPEKEAIEGVRRAFAERGLAFDESNALRLSGGKEPEAFSRALDAIKPDAILSNIGISEIYDLIRKKFDIVNGCRLYTGDIFDDMDYTGLTASVEFAPYAKLAADNFEAQLKSPETAPVLDCLMNLKIRMERRRT